MSKNQTTWTRTMNAEQTGAQFQPLSENIDADVLIVGGGLAGTLTAYLLSESGKKVVMIDKGTLADSTTAYTTACITQVIDSDLSELISMFGKIEAKEIWNAGGEMIDLLEEIIEKEKIDCEFKRVSNFVYANSERESRELAREYISAEEIGIDSLDLHHADFLSFKNAGSLEVKNQAKFHPLKFLTSLRKIVENRGVLVFENTEATDLIYRINHHEIKVICSGGEIRARDVVIATYEPFNKPNELFAHKAMYTTYVFELKATDILFPLREAIYEDMHNPYHYFRVDETPDGLRIIAGGEDHRKEIPNLEQKSFRALKKYIDETFAGMKYKIVSKWSGGILEPSDGIPYIGRYSKENPHLLVATAFSGNGMTWSALSASINSDLILDRHNRFARTFDAGRRMSLKNLSLKARDFVGEFFGGAVKNILQ